jgi:hypothetical protein
MVCEINLTKPEENVPRRLQSIISDACAVYNTNYVYNISIDVSSEVFNALLQHPATYEIFNKSLEFSYSTPETPARVRFGRVEIVEYPLHTSTKSEVHVILAIANPVEQFQKYRVEFCV